MTAKTHSKRVTDPDAAIVDIHPLPTAQATLEELLRDLFEQHWDKITFGPLIQGAAWEFRATHAPTHLGMLDGYLTVAFGASHFHLCIGPHKGSRNNPTSEALARHRRTARAELYRRLDIRRSGLLGLAPLQWARRAAGDNPTSQSVPFAGCRQGSGDAGLVPARSLGPAPSALARPDRARPV
jgi:hypothetical protein